MDNKLSLFFDKNNIKFEEYNHEAVFTVEQAKGIKYNIPGMHTKNLFLSDGEAYYLITFPADKRLSISFLKKHLKKKNLFFSSPEEVERILKVKPGSVSICNLIENKEKIYLIIDSRVWNAESIGFHPNINTSTLVFAKEEFHKLIASLSIKFEILNHE